MRLSTPRDNPQPKSVYSWDLAAARALWDEMMAADDAPRQRARVLAEAGERDAERILAPGDFEAVCRGSLVAARAGLRLLESIDRLAFWVLGKASDGKGMRDPAALRVALSRVVQDPGVLGAAVTLDVWVAFTSRLWDAMLERREHVALAAIAGRMPKSLYLSFGGVEGHPVDAALGWAVRVRASVALGLLEGIDVDGGASADAASLGGIMGHPAERIGPDATSSRLWRMLAFESLGTQPTSAEVEKLESAIDELIGRVAGVESVGGSGLAARAKDLGEQAKRTLWYHCSLPYQQPVMSSTIEHVVGVARSGDAYSPLIAGSFVEDMGRGSGKRLTDQAWRQREEIKKAILQYPPKGKLIPAPGSDEPLSR